MIATAYIEINTREIELAKEEKERLNLPTTEIPKSVMGDVEFMFPLSTVAHAFKTPPDGNIKVGFHNGTNIYLKWDEEVYGKLREYLKHI